MIAAMEKTKSHHYSRFAKALIRRLLRVAAVEWWPVLALKARHFLARDGMLVGVDAWQEPRGAAMCGHYARQRQVGVIRPRRVAPRSARDRM